MMDKASTSRLPSGVIVGALGAEASPPLGEPVAGCAGVGLVVLSVNLGISSQSGYQVHHRHVQRQTAYQWLIG